jgi:peptidyl-prolyl cis-trans isomerase SurA
VVTTGDPFWHVRTILSSLFFGVILILGCSPKEHDAVVATIGDEPLTLSDYEKMYVKSNGTREAGTAASQEDREKFLDLIVKYKLKLKDAYHQGLDKKSDITQEIEQYKGNLAQSFLTEREVTTPGVRQMYKRRTEELHISHILFELKPDASSADSATAYRNAYDVLAQLKTGTDFGTLAVNLSKDPSAKENKGDLYYATGGDLIGPFEDAAYSLKPGEIYPTPVRTRFGLHIIKLIDRKPAPGEVRASHIMIRLPAMAAVGDDTLKAYTKIRKIQDSLATGIDFADLARRNSEDGGSASRGGDLSWFSRRRWVRPFDDTAMVLKVGQISGIVRTTYGYHLIKCTDRRPVKTFEEAKQELETLYQQRRFADDNANFLTRLKKELGFIRRDSVLALFLSSVDSTKTLQDSSWTSHVPPALGKSMLLSVANEAFSLDSVLSLMKARPDLNGINLRAQQVNVGLDRVGEQLLFTHKADLLAKENPDFAAIMREYKEGVLLYQVEQDRIWSKVAPSDSILRLYFNEHREKFTFPDRVRFTDIRLTNEVSALAARQQLLSGMTFEQLVLDDSLRMRLPNNFTAVFPAQSASVSKAVKATLASVAGQMKKDDALAVRITALPDTLKDKKANLDLASKRIQAMKAVLTKEYGVADSKVVLTVTPLAKDSTLSKKDRSAKSQTVTIDLVGRQPRIVGSIERAVSAPGADERAKKADSLALGSISSPFFFRNGYSLLRLDGREPSRQKTLDEAGAEVSTSFQDYEAKRLEKEWIDGLKRQYPVTEQKESLRNAFKANL